MKFFGLSTAIIINSYLQIVTSQMIKECTKPGVVALTFDDGPHDNTPQMLDVLSKKGVKATFFFIGSNVAGKEAIVKRAYDEGHQIASHTWSHPGLPELSADGIKEEMQKTEDALEKAFGKKVRYMRNPRLEENQVVVDTLNGMDYVQVGVNLDTNDWREDRKSNPSLILGTYTDTMASADPASQSFITLQHDHTNFADAKIGEAIDAIKAKGFTFVTSEECLGKGSAYRDGNAQSSPSSPPQHSETTPNKPEDGSIEKPTGPNVEAPVDSTEETEGSAEWGADDDAVSFRKVDHDKKYEDKRHNNQYRNLRFRSAKSRHTPSKPYHTPSKPYHTLVNRSHIIPTPIGN